MRDVIEELEAVGRALEGADPGDFERLRALLRRRQALLVEVERRLDGGDERTDARELLLRLKAVAKGSAGIYRRLMLERLLVQQELAALARQATVLRAFSPARAEEACCSVHSATV